MSTPSFHRKLVILADAAKYQARARPAAPANPTTWAVKAWGSTEGSDTSSLPPVAPLGISAYSRLA